MNNSLKKSLGILGIAAISYAGGATLTPSAVAEQVITIPSEIPSYEIAEQIKVGLETSVNVHSTTTVAQIRARIVGNNKNIARLQDDNVVQQELLDKILPLVEAAKAEAVANPVQPIE